MDSSRSPAVIARRGAKAALRTTSGAMIRALGVDATPRFSSTSCLVVAPHPDDETFGCGATIARKRAAGQQVTVVIVSDGSRSPRPDQMPIAEFVALRQTEARAAAARLGADDVVFLGFEDGTLHENIAAIGTELHPIIESRRPQQVMVTSTHDGHPDHAALGQAVRAIAAHPGLSFEHYEFAIWQRMPALSVIRQVLTSLGENGGSSEGGRSRIVRGRPQLVRTHGHLAAKRRAIDAYVSQLPFLPAGFVADFLQRNEVFIPVSRPESVTDPA